MGEKIPVGISACLLGSTVRFDGGHKKLGFATEELAPYIEFEMVCPEMAIGLPSPRPALRLVRQQDKVIIRSSNDDSQDMTAAMQSFSMERVKHFGHLCGYILCAKSPSCGMERVRVYSEKGDFSKKNGTGIFAQELLKQMPWLPIEEDGRLQDSQLRENFVERIYALAELNALWKEGLTRGGLMAFHSRYKLSLLAHSQPEYRQIGPFVATMDQWTSLEDFAKEYRLRLMHLLANKATRSNHTNVLMHVQGYFRRHLNPAQRQELAQLIDRYRQGMQPLLAPITLIKHYMAEYPDPYLAQQRYFDPYPEALRLRYGH
ncbi:2-thiouracil desulfurase family protein [Yersinia ruckeri]|uniref:Purine nucleoside phosphorylase n=2 Tax=Yersinia ruckeri TaxID=29486 RepID=A0A085U244_YERRU|nr:2-thiouracil desulfurase family protein [Yersinia ruckeri]AKA39626.1 membrane protein [Yersinia ruckeri]ARZ01681.1 hypothetical protein QMA0440_02353 [Yersinia ruckeri]AUQ40550.1 DUF523 domain-containing protein [Yersinia ruckeri]EKN3345354.1 DUF1722 domain-containing protein [Yersinia ruckeri]EKN3363133.1 DUF1722 domain-containing protein [Yersinia ruckeri]